MISARQFLLEPRFLGTLNGGEIRSDPTFFPQKHGTVDLKAAPVPDIKDVFFSHGRNLLSGTAVLESLTLEIRVQLYFPAEFLDTCWLFASYGGWKGYYVLTPEPCNGYPFRLEEAAAAGRAG